MYKLLNICLIMGVFMVSSHLGAFTSVDSRVTSEYFLKKKKLKNVPNEAKQSSKHCNVIVNEKRSKKVMNRAGSFTADRF